jgi:hypothetical protein
MSSTIRVLCTNRDCQTVLSVPRSLEGQRVRCSCCRQLVAVAPASPARLKKFSHQN